MSPGGQTDIVSDSPWEGWTKQVGQSDDVSGSPVFLSGTQYLVLFNVRLHQAYILYDGFVKGGTLLFLLFLYCSVRVSS